MAEQLSPEEIRTEMRRSFDAVNAEAKKRREARYNFNETKQIEEDPHRAAAPQDAVAAAPEIGENDSSGG